MFEKVNPMHPDKIADRIAGALVDYCYSQEKDPKCAFEVLIGHGCCHIVGETSVHISNKIVGDIVNRITGTKDKIRCVYIESKQDSILSKNQSGCIKCGDNGIFKGVPVNNQEKRLSAVARQLFKKYPTDGKFIIRSSYLSTTDEYIVCQSNTDDEFQDYLLDILDGDEQIHSINPLGDWTGGVNVDSGATNRKLGSDMGRAVTGGGIHGKDLSKADVSVNIYAHLKAQFTQKEVELSCAIGDEYVDRRDYAEITEIARMYIELIGGFEKLAEWGLI